MALPSSGRIAMSQINTELGRSASASISLDTAENGGYGAINQNSPSRPNASNPAAMSEWHGYNHSAAGCPASGTLASTYCSGCDYYERYHDGSCNVYAVLVESNSPNCGCGGVTQNCYSAVVAQDGFWEAITCDGSPTSGYGTSGNPINCCINFDQPYTNLDHQNIACQGGCSGGGGGGRGGEE